MFTASGGKKRNRDVDDEGKELQGPFEKRSRATTDSSDGDQWFHHDSVLNTPTTAREQPKYDSDDEQSSSIVSEPGSPQDISMSDGDEGMGGATFSQSPEDNFITHPRPAIHSPWGQRLRTERVPTPAVPMRPGASSPRIRTGPKQHIRKRHPQQNSTGSAGSTGSDHLEVPSPIDEDEVPTPPSAAEAAGSQLSQLTVSDVDMDESDAAPTISIDPARPPSVNANKTQQDYSNPLGPMESGAHSLVVRKQRQRSGALSSGNSPVRCVDPSTTSHKRGFSMGFRADCEKCRLKVPGHMNHFIS
ncbi:Hypothetical predicted protein [Lecanosticta acicola]|uniref:Uncharacterized protein n=1 Tax=Lecanosticta acicola TaxID=111012 RepID=A0AAI9E4F3_9PEZI|nr:Hypothetical predicted protein [Lecanosticta acicola]